MVVMHNFIDSKATISEGTTTTKITFAQALKDKYVDQEEFDNRLVLPKDKKITTQITFVGFGKVTSIQKQLRRLTSIDLSSKCIELPGELEALNGCLDRVQMLNLAGNFLTWQDITTILLHLPSLKELIITENRLDSYDGVSHSLRYLKRSLTSLTLGKVHLDWPNIIKILSRMWTYVEQLDLWDNSLSNETMILGRMDGIMYEILHHLRVLKLSQNNFKDISWIPQIGPLESLTELDLSRCQLQSIKVDSATKFTLKKLTTLNISYNNIDNWESISCLNELDNLRNLICLENPVYISEKFAKFITIGKLGGLKILNREEITRGQRRDAEIFYLRKTFLELEEYKMSGRITQFYWQHPRYEELVKIYEVPEDLTKKQVIDKYINVELCLGDKTISKKLPCDMRVANVKMLCKKLFSLRPASVLEMRCCEAQPSKNAITYKLDKDGQTLHFFSVKSGHRLLIRELE